jgi:2,3-bisphosphoglycerate-independent phosphoglycerate mutase
MIYSDLLPLVQPSEDKIVLLLLSGIGGVQSGPNMLTELQQAHRPHLNALARRALCGQCHPIAPGISPAPQAALKRLLGWEKDQIPDWSTQLGLKACAVSSSTAYLDLFAQAGITAIPSQDSPEALIGLGCAEFPKRDFVIIHLAAAEKEGFRGGYYEKIKIIEELDLHIPKLLELNPPVLAVCGDHSCPSALGAITWHPVPLLIQARTVRYDMVQTFDEIACSAGALGSIFATELLALLLAHAGKLAPIR